MKIGIAGPMSLPLLQSYLYTESPSLRGYPAPIISFLIEGLLRRGHDVSAFTTSEYINSNTTIKGKKLTIHIIKRRPHAGRRLFRAERLDLKRAMKLESLEILNAHWSYEFGWAAVDSGIPCIVTLRDHAQTVLKYQQDFYRVMRYIMDKIVIHKSQYLSTNSKYLFNLLSEKDQAKTIVIPNFYNKRIEDYGAQKSKRKFILTVSNGFGRRKNVQSGLIAFQKIRQKFRDLEYYLIGSEMEVGGPAHSFALENNLSEGVRFLGRLSHNRVLDNISRAILLLHPSREETFGMVVLEAMVLNTVVVGGAESGNIPHLVDDGRFGILCDIDDPENISYMIQDVLRNSEKYLIKSKSARNHACKNYSPENIIPQYLDYYQEVIREEA